MPDVPRPRSRKAAPKTEPTETTESKGTGSATPKGAPSVTPPPTKRTPADNKLAASIRGMYEGAGMLALQFSMGGDPRLAHVGNLLLAPEHRIDLTTGEPVPTDDPRTGAEKITDAWMTLADRNPRVKEMLKRFTEGGAFAELAVLHFGLVFPFLPGIPSLMRLLPGVSSSPVTENVAIS